jgi:hypothetical protein
MPATASPEVGLLADPDEPDEPGLIEDEATDDPESEVDELPSDEVSEPAATAATEPGQSSATDGAKKSEDVAPAAAKAEPATVAPTPATSEAVQPTPFSYRGDRGEHVFEGAFHYPGDGVYVPEAKLPQLKQLLSAGQRHLGSWQRERRELIQRAESAEKGRTEKDVANDAVVALFNDLATAKTDDEVIEWAMNFRARAPEHRLAIRERQLRHREEELKRRAQPSPEEVEAQLDQTFSSELSATLKQLFGQEAAKALTEQDRREIAEEFQGERDVLLRTAREDMPEFGIKKGERYFEGRPLARAIETRVRIRTEAQRAARAAADAAAVNARRAGTGGPTPPPQAKPGSTTADTAAAPQKKVDDDGQPRDRRGRFKSKDEWREFMMRGD